MSDKPINRKLLSHLADFGLFFFFILREGVVRGGGLILISADVKVDVKQQGIKELVTISCVFIKNYLQNLKYNVPNMHVFFI